MATNAQVARAFMERRKLTGSNFRTDGTTLYSYAYPLARWIDDITIEYNTRTTGMTLHTGYLRTRTYDAAYSPTTNRHRTLLMHAFSHASRGARMVYINGQEYTS